MTEIELKPPLEPFRLGMIPPEEPIRIRVNYDWIICQIIDRLGRIETDVYECLKDMDKEQHNWGLMTDATIETGFGISLFEPLKISVDYAWIGEQIRKRTGHLPAEIERVLMELDSEQRNKALWRTT
jgi:hypothetical protein